MFYAVFEISFRKIISLKEQNHTFIALVPKQLGLLLLTTLDLLASAISFTKSFQKFWLIDLNFSYIISSPLSNLLLSLLEISKVTPFLLMNFSTLSRKKKGRGGLMAIKIDMEKAFDRMKWNFLFAILAKLGFHPTWINWICICITSPSFSILINGSPYGPFTPLVVFGKVSLISISIYFRN
jgi:hypothetical protein